MRIRCVAIAGKLRYSKNRWCVTERSVRYSLNIEEGENDMKEKIIDGLARGVVFAGLAWWGLRGVLGDVREAGDLPALLVAGIALIAGYAVGPTTYEAYRCAQKCEPTCEPSFCRAT